MYIRPTSTTMEAAPTLLAILILIAGADISTGCFQTFDTTIQNLFNAINRSQITVSESLLVPFHWRKDRGVYPSHVKANFHGPQDLATLRDSLEIFDNNMFATAWTTTCLLETFKYGKGPKPNGNQLNLALGDIVKHRDMNRAYDNSIMNFWPQMKNKTANYWQNTPVNLLEIFKLTEYLPMKIVEKILTLMGLQDVGKILESLVKERGVFEAAFHIPADFDDSFVNLGLGALLQDLRNEFSDSAKLWQNNNKNISSVIAALSKYAYRPMSSDPRVNSIDPRSYFYLRKFLDAALTKKSPIALVSTWVQNTEEVRSDLDKGVAMPFNINNVDVTVSANTLYGITAGILSGVLKSELFDSDIQQIYLNTTMMIAHEIGNNFTARPDLALTYYPSRYECYWFIARSYALLRRSPQKLPFDVMASALETFASVFRGQVTDELLKSAHTDSQGRVYYDDFLGDGDRDANNKTIVKGEDRIFTTAMAVNTLISTWTGFNTSSNTLYWETGSPTNVKDLVSAAASWLNEMVLSGKFKPWNAFFSGSGKGLDSMPFWFPANRLEYFNGTHFNDTAIPKTIKFIMGFQGVVPEVEYDAMLKQTHFGRQTPVDFHGFNQDPGFFPFWSSDTHTYATTLLALAQFRNID
ncbi:hypothetical protein ScPMuIL_008460 [Solemya velum]